MSFNELTKSNYLPRKKEVVFTVGGKTLTFTANELSAAARNAILSQAQTHTDWASSFIVASITDQEGKYMTMKQAQALNDDFALAFFNAACLVNFGEESVEEKNESEPEKN